jgi:hypothetical protein
MNGTRRPGDRVRRTGMAVVLVLLGSVAAALALARFYHLGVPATVVAVLVGGGSLAGLVLAWAAYRDDRRDAGRTASLAEAADQLAAWVGIQWEGEAAVRRLNDPYPLPVSWRAPDVSLGDGWDVLVRLAAGGHGWPAPPPPGTWAGSPAELAGEGRDLAKVLARVPTGRLVVLGAPGAGKTMLMVGLVLDLLADRARGGPVPVLASLASWNPEEQDLHSWLSAQLAIDYPALDTAAPRDTGGGSLIEAMLRGGSVDGRGRVSRWRIGCVDAGWRGGAVVPTADGLGPDRRLVAAGVKRGRVPARTAPGPRTSRLRG